MSHKPCQSGVNDLVNFPVYRVKDPGNSHMTAQRLTNAETRSERVMHTHYFRTATARSSRENLLPVFLAGKASFSIGVSRAAPQRLAWKFLKIYSSPSGLECMWQRPFWHADLRIFTPPLAEPEKPEIPIIPAGVRKRCKPPNTRSRFHARSLGCQFSGALSLRPPKSL